MSSVFKDYLQRCSILTDNTADKSTYCLDNEETEERAKIEKGESTPDGKSSGENKEADDMIILVKLHMVVM